MTRRWRSALVAAATMLLTTITVAGADPAYAAACPTVDLATGTVSPRLVPGATYLSCNLAGADLRGADLSFVEFQGGTLAGARLEGALLLGAFVSGGSLAGAQLSDADLTGAAVVSTSLAGADLDGAILDFATIAGADVGGASLTGARIGGLTSSGLVGVPATSPASAVVAGGVLLGPGVSLPGVALEDLDLRAADLTRADLRGARLERVDLRGADVAGADLRSATITSSQLTGVTGMSSALVSQATSWDGSTCPDGRPNREHISQRCDLGPDTTPPTASIAPMPAVVVFRSFARPTVRILHSDPGTAAWNVTHQVRIASARSGGGGLSTWAVSGWSTDEVVPTGAASGRRTCVQVRARDLAGNVSAWSPSRCFDVPVDEARLASTQRWRSRVSESYQEAYAVTTVKRGQSLTTTSRTVRTVGILAMTCPTCGTVAVYVGTRKVGSLSTRRSTTARSLLLLPRLSSPSTGKVKVVVRSQGRPVTIDGIAVSAY